MNEIEQQWEIYSQKMEELMAQLPQMQALDRQRTKYRQAIQVAEADEQLQLLLKEQAHAQAEAEKYRQTGNQGLYIYIENQIGYRKGPIAELMEKRKQLLNQGDFPDIETAQEALPAPGVLEQMDAQIQIFQKVYAETLAVCRQLDRQMSEQASGNLETALTPQE